MFDGMFGIGENWPWLAAQTSPFFLYSVKAVKKNVSELKHLWSQVSPSGQIFFSIKANPNYHLIKVIGQLVDGFDVSTEAEFKTAETLFRGKPNRITCSGPAKTDNFLTLLRGKGIYCLHLDSHEEYVATRHHPVPKSIRIANDESFSQKVGMPDADIEQILQNARPREFVGFHVYIGREQFSPAKFRQVVERMRRYFEKKPTAFANPVQVFFGAGLPQLDLFDFAELTRIQSDVPKGWIVHLEAGRGIVHSAGIYSARVLAVKPRDGGKKIIIIDGGLQHLATNMVSPRFGGQNVDVAAFREGQWMGAGQANYQINGSLGLWHDVLVPAANLPPQLQRGDWLLFKPAGAYGWTSASNQFIGPTKVREYLIQDNAREEIHDVSPANLMSYLQGF